MKRKLKKTFSLEKKKKIQRKKGKKITCSKNLLTGSTSIDKDSLASSFKTWGYGKTWAVSSFPTNSPRANEGRSLPLELLI